MSTTRRGAPVSTYRLQLEPDFTLDDAVAQVDHVADLGVTHLYLSPILQAAPGSTHGYDVTDHTRVAEGIGGDAAFARLVEAARGRGLGIVVDVVPNHMTVPTPVRLNAPLWDVLREGRASRYAAWFDVDWDAQDGKILMPVLGGPLEQALAAGELAVDATDGEPVVRYYDHEFPVAPGTEGMPLTDLLGAQHYRLADWRLGGTELNYRRFFDVTSLIAVRVEEPEVFDATHKLLVEHVRAGGIDGLRIDHPDGLADPEGYLERLAEATGGVWVVVEKILEGHEQLPTTWPCAGTTGYDALQRVGGLFVDPAGEEPLTEVSAEHLGEPQDLDEMVVAAKTFVVERVQAAEVERLLRLVARARPDLDPRAAHRALTALLVAMDRYRVYVRPGHAHTADVAALQAVADRARTMLARDDAPAVAALVDLALDRATTTDEAAQREFCVRFQQTCGPVMAKGIEDTTFYRFVRLTSLNEVGGDPGTVGVAVEDFHDFCAATADAWPSSMTTLTTHDTKRSEDVRARLAVLSERPQQWAAWLRRARALAAAHRGQRLDPATEYLLWQTVVGAWPIDHERLAAYATKAVREAKVHTTWTDPDPAYEQDVADFVAGLTTDPAIGQHITAWHADTLVESRANILGQKLIQLTMPGVPDVYQGTSGVALSLVDPDNRRPVDYAAQRTRLERLDDGGRPADLDDEKLLVTSQALRLRRERPEVFVGEAAGYAGLPTTSDHAVGFSRGSGRPEVVVVATRLAGRLADDGGWADATIELPSGTWRDALSDRRVGGGEAKLSELLPADGLPVALLARDPDDDERK
ncbi:MAG TPA: malto-oligosyltrehalose synthase [Intrasporangium sp.]|uniref:malto-oligosyltrehalose synthase n=1 Tax=Intrasporangium sp. TaxID=1925024 RepID=UPI002D791CDA|nr:malto-oligosyltrehalose synthase [Intrasporangium sp.]HET7398599.1 malto-oligosyltrehalose synthase [Intrasporangium sp.]